MKTVKPFFVIIGLGQTGLSCAGYCIDQGIDFAVTDSRASPPQAEALAKLAPHVQVASGKLSAALIRQASTLLVSPGVAMDDPAIVSAAEEGINIMGDVELFMRQVTAPVVAITGSNGKTTVTRLVGEMMAASKQKVSIAGNIGVPVLDVLKDKADVYVLELSSFQLERTASMHAEVAALLNICEDHLDRYQDMMSYLTAKKQVFHHCQHAVVCRDDPQLYPVDPSVPCVSFALDAPADGHFGIRQQAGEHYLAQGEQCLLPVSQLASQADHHILNILAALAIGSAHGLTMADMLVVVERFAGLPHRCQLVDEFAGVCWYNDSKATNIGATIAALSGLSKVCEGKIILIAGGQGKGMDFEPLRSVVQKFVRKVIVMGEMAMPLQRQLNDVADVEKVNNMAEAVNLAELYARRGDIVLLSPACASFDMFNNFEHRGETFMRLVKAL